MALSLIKTYNPFLKKEINHEVDEFMNDVKIGEFCWNELGTSDIVKAKNFYTNVFGWEFQEISAGEMTYTLIKKGQGDAFAGMWEIPKSAQDQIPSHWISYVQVDKLETALNKAKQYGANVVRDVTEVGGMGRLAIITDPTGAYLAFWEVLQNKSC